MNMYDERKLDTVEEILIFDCEIKEKTRELIDRDFK